MTPSIDLGVAPEPRRLSVEVVAIGQSKVGARVKAKPRTGLDHPTKSNMIAGMFRAIVFFGLIASAFASEKLDVLVNAAASFSATIQQQLEMLQSSPAPADLAEKTIDYAEAKIAYFTALRAAAPELTNIATGKEARPLEVDKFAAAFAVAGEDQEKAADEQTAVLLKRFPGNPDVEKARAKFGRAQEVEERFHHDFDGVDFTMR
jgi:hypothetical protein